MNSLLLVVTIAAVTLCGGALGDRKEDALAELRKLNSETADDSMVCLFKWGKEARAACRKEKEEKKHVLLKRVLQYWKVDEYITPVDACSSGYATFNIGSFDDPVRLPCDEQAFALPKHSDDEIDAMYKELLKMWNAYDQICLTTSCKEGKEARGLALAKKIKYAEDEGMIPPKCQKGGTGWYSFYSGMQEVECPCIYTDPAKSGDSTTTATA